MNLQIVQKEIEAWPPKKQDQLAAYLATLRLTRNPDHAQELGRRRDDRDPESWMTLAELKERLQRG